MAVPIPLVEQLLEAMREASDELRTACPLGVGALCGDCVTCVRRANLDRMRERFEVMRKQPHAKRARGLQGMFEV